MSFQPLISFIPLHSSHFPLLHKWMNAEHVQKWWGENQSWTLEDISSKYDTYCKGYKVVEGQKKTIHSFIIEISSQPIGFIQYYNAYDFPRERGEMLTGLPKRLAALDLYIGETSFFGKGFGFYILDRFLKEHISPSFEACFVDPNCHNIRAIKAYEKAGFVPISHSSEKKDIWMINLLTHPAN
ncbi:MAG: acetyltransferase [Alphaproteobacteria bacterium]|nr:acetyltransferase [Alphaproteobacteria bacterium]